MIPCISQATTLSTPISQELTAYSRAGWTSVELWLTKLEQHLENVPLPEVCRHLSDLGLTPAAASLQGGLLTSVGDQREVHWSRFQKRLEILQALSIPVLVIAPDFWTEADETSLGRAIASLAAASELSRPFGVRLALEFTRGGTFCTSLDTALALVAQAAQPNLGVCLDIFHYYTGPSKFEDLGYLDASNLAWVQVSDLAGTPRELARDSDRILPGDGDFQLIPILDHLSRIGYDGGVSLEASNPSLWEIPVDRVADVSRQALLRLLGQLTETPLDPGA